MSQLVTPLQNTRDQIATVLNNLGAPIFKHGTPTEGAPVPSIVLNQIAGIGEEVGIGQQYDSRRAMMIRTRWQIDVYELNPEGRDALSDKVVQAINENRTTLAAGNVFDARIVGIRNLQSAEFAEKVYRRAVDIEAWSPITRA